MLSALVENQEETYQIWDGVRRAKAALLCGRKTINARIVGVGEEIQIPLTRLRSPKDSIETRGVRGIDWGKVLRATRNGQIMAAIEIGPGKGVPLEEVSVEDEFNLY